MKKLVLLLVGALTLAGCAGQQLKSDWKDKRGYSEEDINLITEQYKEYAQMTNAAVISRSSVQSVNADNRLKSIFCSCVKKMGDQCRTRAPASMNPQDKTLWIKANAVDMAYVGQSMTWETSQHPVIDSAECN